MNAITCQNETCTRGLSAREPEKDVIFRLTSVHTLHSGSHVHAVNRGKQRSMQVAAVQNDHAQAFILAIKPVKVGGLEQITSLVQKIDLMDRLCLAAHRLIQSERAKCAQSIRAKAEAGTHWLELRRLLVDFYVPAKEAQALRHE
jgi:hypothetical protein